MKYLKSLLSVSQENNFSHLGLLVLRIMVGWLMMRHGFGKMENYNEYSGEFYNFLGLGPAFSLQLTIFAEFFCSLFILIGLFTRYFSIPLIITMIVIVFVVHGENELGEKELPVLYLGCYLVLLLKGSGKFSVDNFLSR